MTPEIKRLLKLSSIPNFKLSAKEQATLEAWKATQKPIKPRRKMRSEPSKSRSKATSDLETIEVSSEAEKGKIGKIQNVVRTEDLILNSES